MRINERRMTPRQRFVWRKFMQAYMDDSNFKSLEFKDEIARLGLPYGISNDEWRETVREIAEIAISDLPVFMEEVK